MATRRQKQALQYFGERAVGWEDPRSHPGVSPGMFETLVDMGYVEANDAASDHASCMFRLTEQGKHALDDDVWPV